jgi:integrase
MPRPAKIWLRKQTGFYCTTVKGEIVRLSKDKKQAEALFHDLMAQKAREDTPEPARQLGPSFKKLADDWLVQTQGQKDERTVKLQVRVIQPFCNRIKGMRAADLKGHTVTDWLAWENQWRQKKNRKLWNTSTQSFAIKTIKAALNWGVKMNYLDANPIKKLSGGKVARRDRTMAPAEMERIRTVVTPDFYDFLFVCSKTGARPYTEIGRLEARLIDFPNGTATLTKHKNARKTGKPRVLFFTPEVLEILKRQAERYPSGPLFRTRRNTAWNQSNCWKWFDTIKKKTGIDFFTYALRHTRITEALVNGVPVEVVAELVGNTPQIIHRHYSHVGRDQEAMKAAARKAAG